MADMPSRRDVKRALREAGLSDRQARALLSDGWRGLVGAREAEIAELEETLAELSDKIGIAHRMSASDGA